MTKRPIAPLALEGVAPGAPPTPPPVPMLVRPGELLIDESYQRGLSDGSLRLIRRIVAEFDWRRWKAPNVVETSDGYVVLDGQHSLIAAASHPDIDEVPVLIVQAEEQRDQAQAFVGINTTRIGITPVQLHHANVVAGDAAALAVERVCAAAEVRLLRVPPAGSAYKARETIAVAVVAGLVKRRGEATATQVLRILGEAGCAPVAAAQIRAVEALLTEPEFGDLDPEALARTVQDLGTAAAEKEAKAFAATHCTPLWRGLAATWFKAGKKRRRPSASTGASQPGLSLTEAVPVPSKPVTAASVRPAGAARPASALRSRSTHPQRPARGAWAPGVYSRRCTECDELFTGAQAATACELCAYGDDEAA